MAKEGVMGCSWGKENTSLQDRGLGSAVLLQMYEELCRPGEVY